MTLLLIHRKLPVTARTAGSCDRPEAPTATPAFILLFFSSSKKGPGGRKPPFQNGREPRPKSGLYLLGGTGTLPLPQSRHTAAHRGKQGLCLFSLRLARGSFSLSTASQYWQLAGQLFFSLYLTSGHKVGPGFRPETALAATRSKPDALLAPPKGG